MQIRQDHLRHDMTADARKHRPHDAERHDDETDTENRIETRDQRVNRKKCRKEVINQDNDEPDLDRANRAERQQLAVDEHSRPRRKDRADEDEKHDREDAHDEEHRLAHVIADDLRDALAVFTQRNHARHIVVHAARENRAENDPEVDARSPKRPLQSAENRSETSDIQKLDHEDLPRRQRNVIHAVIVHQCRRRLVRRRENHIDNPAVDDVAQNQSEQCHQKCNHRKSLSFCPSVYRPSCRPSSPSYRQYSDYC